MFNITRMIRDMNENGTFDPSFFKDVSFSETSSKSVEYVESDGNRIPYVITETLSQNVVAWLPFEFYEPLVSLGWATSPPSNDQFDSLSVASRSLYNGNSALANKFLALGESEKIVEASFGNETLRLYNKTVLEPILNFPLVLSNFEESADKIDPPKRNSHAAEYSKTFLKAVEQFEKSHISLCSACGSEPQFEAANWAKHYDVIERTYSPSLPKASGWRDATPFLFDSGTRSSRTALERLIVYEDAVYLLKNAYAANKKIYAEHAEQSLGTALSYGNASGLSFLMKAFNDDGVDVGNRFDPAQAMSVIISGCCSATFNETGDEMKILKSVELASSAFGEDVVRVPAKLAAKLFSFRNKKVLEAVAKTFPQLLKDPILADMDLAACRYAETVAKAFLEANGANLPKHDIRIERKDDPFKRGASAFSSSSDRDLLDEDSKRLLRICETFRKLKISEPDAKGKAAAMNFVAERLSYLIDPSQPPELSKKKFEVWRLQRALDSDPSKIRSKMKI